MIKKTHCVRARIEASGKTMNSQTELTPEPSPLAIEYAKYSLHTGKTQFVAFTAGQSCEVVEVGGRRLRVSGYNHVISVEDITVPHSAWG